MALAALRSRPDGRWRRTRCTRSDTGIPQQRMWHDGRILRRSPRRAPGEPRARGARRKKLQDSVRLCRHILVTMSCYMLAFGHAHWEVAGKTTSRGRAAGRSTQDRIIGFSGVGRPASACQPPARNPLRWPACPPTRPPGQPAPSDD